MRYRSLLVLIKIHLLVLFFLFGFGCQNGDPKNKNTLGYKGPLEPIPKVWDNLSNYEKATETIIKNWDRLKAEDLDKKKNNNETPLKDSILNLQHKELGLRFMFSLNNGSKVNESDTLIIFNSSLSDFNVISLEDGTRLIYNHKLFYSNKNKQIGEYNSIFKTPCTRLEIKKNYLYDIDSRKEL